MQSVVSASTDGLLYVARLGVLGTMAVFLGGLLPSSVRAEAPIGPGPAPGCRVPAVRNSPYAAALLCNALEYARPEHKTIDPESGYPVEGWNQDAQHGLFLRSFTQLTAIGQWLELLGNVVAGDLETPWLRKEEAITQLTRAADSLRRDQHDPAVSEKGLLDNFFDLGTRNRLAQRATRADKQQFTEMFGREKGALVWRALVEKSWLKPAADGSDAEIRRASDYGPDGFTGPLQTYSDGPTKQKVLAILDRSDLVIAFGDNANLSLSVARTIGALLRAPGSDPRLAALREKLEGFLAQQQAGYEFLYDREVGLFYFGWEAGKNRFFGWKDLQGQTHVGHMDYLVNEFRGPTIFVILRYGLPTEALANLGFHIKPYRLSSGESIDVLAPWEGSAFQGMGFSLTKAELGSPSWRLLLDNFVRAELDYSQRHGLPGFLSESYTGVDAQYSGSVAISDIAVNPLPRITDAPSLYTLGAAYTIDTARIEQFLKTNWPTISSLLTDHGPWEGYNVKQHQPIKIQTSTHTFALALGLLGTAPEDTRRYYREKGLRDRLHDFYRPGTPADLLANSMQIYAWADNPDAISSARQTNEFMVKVRGVKRVGIAFVSEAEPMNLSGGLVKIRYRSDQPIDSVSVTFKPAGPAPPTYLIPKEALASFSKTNGAEKELQIVLPATPGLNKISQVVLTREWSETSGPITLAIKSFKVTPYQR